MFKKTAPIQVLNRLSSNEKGLENSGLDGDSIPDLRDAGAVLHQFSYQAHWEVPVGLIAPLVEHCTPIAEARVLITVQVLP